MSRISEPTKPFAVEMVLTDREGMKIQATIRKPMLRKFSSVVNEGCVYVMSFFGVVSNGGSYRATRHEYKLLFHFKTCVTPCDDITIPMNVLSLSNCDEINQTNGTSNFFVDVIGVIKAVSEEKVSAKEGKTMRLIQVELQDDSGSIKCALFGKYVDTLKEFLVATGEQLPTMVLQYAQIKSYQGEVVVQNVLSTTRLLLDPQIDEALLLKNRLIAKGINLNVSMMVIEDRRMYIPPMKDFIEMYPRKTISQLHTTEEDGIFIVLATIVFVLNVDQWYYLACKCHKAVATKDDLYYCPSCQTNVVNVIPRYCLRVEVFDGSDTAAFTLFDSDCSQLLQQSCAVVVKDFKPPIATEHPDAFHKIIGMELLFKVEKDPDYSFRFDDSYRVKKICDDVSII